MATEQHTITPELTVNAIILRHPATVGVFQRVGIDSCCGGGLPLQEAARRHALNLDELLAELEAVTQRRE